MPTVRDCPRCGSPIPDTAPGGECPACLLTVALDPGVPTAADLQPYFPDLLIGDLIGRGGMGLVYLARQTTLDRQAAVKILDPDRADDPGYDERFLNEARTMAKLNHPHIVGVYDVGRVEDLVFLVMEYIPGVSLREKLQAGRLPPREALRLIPQLCDALQYAHDHGIVHRDIKPENVLLDAAGNVKLTDFGLAKCSDGTAARLTGSGDRLGTPRYMAPEQMKDTAAVDHRADIYSLGVLFYEMLTGDLPTPGYTAPSAKVGTDRRLDRVVSKSLKDEPAERYQHAADVKSDVERIAAGRRWPVPAAIAGTLVLLGLAAWLIPAGQPVVPPLSPAEVMLSPGYEWTPPENLGPGANSDANEASPSVSADGLTLVFHSNRPGGLGADDIWTCTRKSVEEPFADPVNLGPNVNSPGAELDPWLSADGRTLLFVTFRRGTGDGDIWQSRRTDAGEWGPAETLGPTVNSRFAEYRPCLSDDGLTLTFSSLRPPPDGMWVARRPTPDAAFTTAVPLGADSHLKYVGGVSFAAGGKVVVCNRLNRVFPGDLLWLGRVESMDDPFAKLVSFGPTVNTTSIDANPVASADGRTVYFHSNRPGSLGQFDLWQTRRVKKPAPGG